MNDKPANIVNCKSCGAVIDVSADPDNWPLQCKQCKAMGAKLPKGYEQLKDSKHDN